jgi:hypothetical protein
MKTFSEYLTEVQSFNPRWLYVDGYWNFAGSMSELEDLIPELSDDQLIGGLYNHKIHLADIPNPSRKVLEWVIKERPYFLVELHDIHIIPEDLVKKILVSEDFMLNWHERLYNQFVEEYFKNNTILMNKWLRYAQNIRSLPTGKGS